MPRKSKKSKRPALGGGSRKGFDDFDVFDDADGYDYTDEMLGYGAAYSGGDAGYGAGGLEPVAGVAHDDGGFDVLLSDDDAVTEDDAAAADDMLLRAKAVLPGVLQVLATPVEQACFVSRIGVRFENQAAVWKSMDVLIMAKMQGKKGGTKLKTVKRQRVVLDPVEDPAKRQFVSVGTLEDPMLALPGQHVGVGNAAGLGLLTGKPGGVDADDEFASATWLVEAGKVPGVGGKVKVSSGTRHLMLGWTAFRMSTSHGAMESLATPAGILCSLPDERLFLDDTAPHAEMQAASTEAAAEWTLEKPVHSELGDSETAEVAREPAGVTDGGMQQLNFTVPKGLAPPPPLQRASSEPGADQTVVCRNCDRAIPKSSFTSHIYFCYEEVHHVGDAPVSATDVRRPAAEDRTAVSLPAEPPVPEPVQPKRRGKKARKALRRAAVAELSAAAGGGGAAETAAVAASAQPAAAIAPKSVSVGLRGLILALAHGYAGTAWDGAIRLAQNRRDHVASRVRTLHKQLRDAETDIRMAQRRADIRARDRAIRLRAVITSALHNARIMLSEAEMAVAGWAAIGGPESVEELYVPQPPVVADSPVAEPTAGAAAPSKPKPMASSWASVLTSKSAPPRREPEPVQVSPTKRTHMPHSRELQGTTPWHMRSSPTIWDTPSDAAKRKDSPPRAERLGIAGVGGAGGDGAVPVASSPPKVPQRRSVLGLPTGADRADRTSLDTRAVGLGVAHIVSAWQASHSAWEESARALHKQCEVQAAEIARLRHDIDALQSDALLADRRSKEALASATAVLESKMARKEAQLRKEAARRELAATRTAHAEWSQKEKALRERFDRNITELTAKATEAEEAAQRMLERTDGVNECVICWENGIDTLLQPCMHVALCSRCASSVTTCPVCRAEVTSRARVYKASLV